MTASDQRLGAMIRDRRKSLGLTQTQVADAGGPSTALLRSLENGRLTAPSDRVAKDLERILGWQPGAISVFLNDGSEPVLLTNSDTTTVAERRHREILARLDRIAELLENLAQTGRR